jgi:uncharacterized protein (TIGR00369 family)
VNEELLIERLKPHIENIGMMHHMGVELVAVTEDTAEIAFIVDDRSRNNRNMVHGGAIAAVLDTVAFLPGCLLPSGRKLTTSGMEIHFFRPAEMGERITARSKILRNGRRLITIETEAFNGAGLKMAHGIVTLFDLES